jgi:hypothetical protein
MRFIVTMNEFPKCVALVFMFCTRQVLKIAKGKQNGILVVDWRVCRNGSTDLILADGLAGS